MELDFAFPVTEGAVAGVCGIGDMQCRMIFVGEQVREIGLERAVGTSETFVRVVPAFGFWLRSLLCEKCLPVFVPGFEPFGEALPMEFCQL